MSFCKYWHLTPTDYRNLTVLEHEAMVEVMKDINREQRRAQAKKR